MTGNMGGNAETFRPWSWTEGIFYSHGAEEEEAAAAARPGARVRKDKSSLLD